MTATTSIHSAHIIGTQHLRSLDFGCSHLAAAVKRHEAECRENDGTQASLRWTEIPGSRNVCPLSLAGPYVISHRPNCYTLSYRPPGEHQHVAQVATLIAAKREAQRHATECAALS